MKEMEAVLAQRLVQAVVFFRSGCCSWLFVLLFLATRTDSFSASKALIVGVAGQAVYRLQLASIMAFVLHPKILAADGVLWRQRMLKSAKDARKQSYRSTGTANVLRRPTLASRLPGPGWLPVAA